MNKYVAALVAVVALNQELYASIWSDPQLFAPANVANAQDWRVVFAPDNLSFYEESERNGHFADTQILRSTRIGAGSPWSTPTPVNELNSPDQDHFYWISQDQTEAFMARHGNTVPNTFADLYRTTRLSPSDLWGTPTIINELSSPGTFEWHLSLTADGLQGVFSLTRTGGGGGGMDLWQTSRLDRSSPWTTPTPVLGLNTGSDERSPQLSVDGLTVYFCRFGLGIFGATRASLSDPFSAPVNQKLNNSAIDPTLSPDGNTLFYTMPNGSQFNYDIYYSTRVPEPVSAMLLMLAFCAFVRMKFSRSGY